MTSDNFYKQPTLVGLGQNQRLEKGGDEGRQSHSFKQIGGYKVESFLNKGGTSELYLAVQPETHEPVALKVLAEKYLTHPEMIERFLHEAEIIKMTCHPNIVKLFGYGKWEGGVYIAMEFIQGISLRQMILQEAMPLKRSLEVILQISHALTHLHAHGIIHRDLKPENILLTAEGGIKVIDFGISQIYKQKEPELKHRMLGTPIYMSPEQRANPLNVNFATDIYALGVISYELILGRLSHGSIHLALLPKGLQKIVAKMLRPNPEDRYTDIVDFISDLTRYMESKDLAKDQRGSDYLGELGESLKSAQNLLLPTHLPTWSAVEVAIASNTQQSISTLYYDFFERENGALCVLLCESMAKGVDGLLYIAQLKGMLGVLVPRYENPKELIQEVNDRVIRQGHEQIYTLSFLTLKVAENRLNFLSCGYSPLWHIPNGSKSARRLNADNVALGIASGMEWMEVSAPWNEGDQLLLHSFQAGLSKSVGQVESDEGLFVQALEENLFLAPKKQVDAIFRKVARKDERHFFERPVTLIGIYRRSSF